MKLSRAIGALSKLKDKTNDNILKMGCHSLFICNLNYGFQI